MLHFSYYSLGSWGKDTEVDHWRREWQTTSVSLPWKPHGHIKKQRSHFANKGLYSQSHGFSSSHVWMWEVDHKEGWALKNWCFQIVVLEKTLEGSNRSNQSILKEISPEYSLEGLMLKLKLQYFGHLIQRTDSLEKTLILGNTEDKQRRGQQRMRWHYWLSGHEFEQTVGGSEGQGSLAAAVHLPKTEIWAHPNAQSHERHSMEAALVVLEECLTWNYTAATIGNGWSQLSECRWWHIRTHVSRDFMKRWELPG